MQILFEEWKRLAGWVGFHIQKELKKLTNHDDPDQKSCVSIAKRLNSILI